MKNFLYKSLYYLSLGLMIVFKIIICTIQGQTMELTDVASEKNNREQYSFLKRPGAIEKKRFVMILPQPGCLSQSYDSLLFHGVSSSKSSISKTVSCEQPITVFSAIFSATNLSGYRNILPLKEEGSRPAEVLPRWAEDKNWLILGFVPLGEDTILVETENHEGDYRVFHVRIIEIKYP